MELNSITLSDFTKLATVIWTKAKESVPQYARTSGLFKVIPIPANTGSTREFSEIDLEEYADRKGQSDQAERAQVQQGYSSTMTSYRVAKDIGISYEMRTQNKYPEIVSRLTNLGGLAPNRLDLDLTHRITFASSTSYTDKNGVTVTTTVGDTFQLAYSAHTLAGSSTTFRNILANNPQLSRGALESMENLCVNETYNQFGEKMVMNFNILWTGDDPVTINMAKELLKATSSTESGVNTGVPNVFQTKYRHVVFPRVATTAAGAPDSTKYKYWGLASSEHSTAYCGIWEEPHLKTPVPLNAGEEFATDDWNYGVRAGYGIVTVSASWFKMSLGDGTA